MTMKSFDTSSKVSKVSKLSKVSKRSMNSSSKVILTRQRSIEKLKELRYRASIEMTTRSGQLAPFNERFFKESMAAILGSNEDATYEEIKEMQQMIQSEYESEREKKESFFTLRSEILE